MAEELQASIEAYEGQLEQVTTALTAAGSEGNDDLVELKSNLEQLIALTKQSLLETKKKELLDSLDQYEEKTDDNTKDEPEPEADDNEKQARDNDMIGHKCRAPFKSKQNGSVSYHSAIVFGQDSASEVKVVFSHPTEQAMIPCQFYMDGRCRFDDQSCKYSHGELVSIADLKDYVEPDYSRLKEGDIVLAIKEDSGGVWCQGTIDMMGADGLVVRFNSKSAVNVQNSEVWPLTSEDSDDKNEDYDEENFAPHVAFETINANAGQLGEWEKHTRGIASKLMAKMGYVHGSGLGKDSRGRVEPVPASIYPSGKSLDWCMEQKIMTVEKMAGIQKKKAAKASEKKPQESVFDFINMKLSKDKSSTTAASTSKSSSDLRVRNLQIDENISKLERDIVSLEKSRMRHKGKDHVTFNAIEAKIADKRRQISSLKRESSSVRSEQNKAKGRQKLTIF